MTDRNFTCVSFSHNANDSPITFARPRNSKRSRKTAATDASDIRARLELADHPVDGYWVAAGYPYAGEVPSSRLRPGHY